MIEVVEKKEIELIPNEFEKDWFNWLHSDEGVEEETAAAAA